MKRRSLIEAFVLVVYLAIVFTLVRPGSQGPALVAAIGSTLSGLITAAAGSGGWQAAGPAGPATGGAPMGGVLYA